KTEGLPDQHSFGWHVLRTLTDSVEVSQDSFDSALSGYPTTVSFRRVRGKAEWWRPNTLQARSTIAPPRRRPTAWTTPSTPSPADTITATQVVPTATVPRSGVPTSPTRVPTTRPTPTTRPVPTPTRSGTQGPVPRGARRA